MRCLFVGDVHNHTYIFDDIKRLDSKYELDKIIFMGDYVDDWDTDNHQSIKTLNAVLALKKSNPEKYILLLGNHELSYLGFPCSGHMYENDILIQNILEENLDLFNFTYKLCLKDKIYTCSHAGITSNYLEFLEKELDVIKEDILTYIENHKKESLILLNTCSSMRGGRDECSSFLWCDKNEHKFFNLINMSRLPNQIVGHTPVKSISTENEITYIDTHSTHRDGTPFGDRSYLLWNNEEFNIIKEIE